MKYPDWLVPPYWVFQLYDHFRGVRWLSVGRWTIGTISFLLVIVTGFAWSTARNAQGLVEIRQVQALTDLPTGGPEPVLSIGTKVGGSTQKPQASTPGDTYLVVGVDSREGKDGAVGAGTGADVEGVRSDTVALAHVTSNGVPKVVSIPRDTSVYRPECRQWDPTTEQYRDQTVPADPDAKINSAYAVGGPRCLVATVQQLTGIKITKFVGVDFAGLISIVNSVGGVDLTTEHALVDDELGMIVPSAGTHHLRGKQALNFARARKIAEEGRSDYGRIKRQQQLAAALVATIKQKILRQPSSLEPLAESFHDDVFGDNIGMDDILSQMNSLTGAQYQTVPTSGTNENGNEVVDRDKLATMLQLIWGGTIG